MYFEVKLKLQSTMVIGTIPPNLVEIGRRLKRMNLPTDGRDRPIVLFANMQKSLSYHDLSNMISNLLDVSSSC